MSTRWEEFMKAKLTEKEVAQVRTLIEERWPPEEIDTEFPKWVGNRIAKNVEQEMAFLKEDQDIARASETATAALDDAEEIADEGKATTKKVARR